MPEQPLLSGRLDREPDHRAEAFSTTHWSVVLEAGAGNSTESAAALERLCQTYWYPLYVFVRRKGYSPHDAQDLTQEFFARLLEHKYVALADQSRGKFRTFLIRSLEHFLINEWRRARLPNAVVGSRSFPGTRRKSKTAIWPNGPMVRRLTSCSRSA